MLPPDGQETRAEKTNVTVDTLTEFYARYSGLPSRFRNGSVPGQQTGRLSARPRPPSVAISVGTTPMIAIPVAAFMGSVAMIVGPAPQTWCNHFGLSRPMIAIPVAAFMGSVAMIVGPAPQTWCNHFGLSRPMIAIPTADDCDSLQLGSIPVDGLFIAAGIRAPPPAAADRHCT